MRWGAVGLTVLVALSLSGCMLGAARAEDANRADYTRLDALRTDPYLAPGNLEVARFGFGSNGLYNPGTASDARVVSGPRPVAVDRELAAAARSGWLPYYAHCSSDDEDGYDYGTRDDFGDDPDGPAVVRDVDVVLSRQLDDGALADLVLTFYDVSEQDAEADTWVRVDFDAAVPHHSHPQLDRPTTVDPSELGCLGGAGGDEIGESIDLTTDPRREPRGPGNGPGEW